MITLPIVLLLASLTVVQAVDAAPSTVSTVDGEALINVDPDVVEEWYGGYKIEITFEAETDASGWQLVFVSPHRVRAAYGIDVADNGDGSFTVHGQNDQVDLAAGQAINAVLIIDDDGDGPVPLSFPSATDGDTTAPTEPQPEPEPNDPGSDPEPQPEPEPAPGNTEQQGRFAYGEALQLNFLFFEANRSGELPADNRLEWRSDSTTSDGSTVNRDLEGGYFDAGDHVKFGQPMAAGVTMLAWGGVEYRDAYQQAGQFDELLDAVRWGTDYFLKAHETVDGRTERLWVQVGEGSIDHGYWGAPETVEANTVRNAFAIDAANPGSDVAASTAAAFAASSILFRGVDDGYADELLTNARQLYDFAEQHRGKYSDSVSAANPYYTSWSGYGDELVSGATWLHRATGETAYLDKAEGYYSELIGALGDWTWAGDDHRYSAAVMLADQSDDPKFDQQVEGWLDLWINGEGGVNYTDGGFAHRATWGSVPLTAATAFLAQLYHDTVNPDSRYSRFANQQIDYILGDNPADLSYMIGFGDNYPLRPHHRGSAPDTHDPLEPMENVLYGAVVGGPGSPDDFSHNDRRDDWVTNEVAITYNAPVASALIQQYANLGGDPLGDDALDALAGVDANGVGR